jgi:hypothetical protein
MTDKGTRITTVCSETIANHIALQHQLASQKKCYVAWMNSKASPNETLILLHQEILANEEKRPVTPIYFVRAHQLLDDTRIDQCSMCIAGIPECLPLR